MVHTYFPAGPKRHPCVPGPDEEYEYWLCIPAQVVKHGGVRIYMKSGDESVRGYRGE